MILSELDKAYLAGIIDGEGSITITKRNRWATTGTYQYNLQVIVGNTSLKLIKWLESKLPDAGSYTYSKANKEHPNWRLSFLFCLTGRKAWEILKLIVLYLIIKRGQAELGINFGYIKGFHQGLRPNKETLDMLDTMHQQMSNLNHSDLI